MIAVVVLDAMLFNMTASMKLHLCTVRRLQFFLLGTLVSLTAPSFGILFYLTFLFLGNVTSVFVHLFLFPPMCVDEWKHTWHLLIINIENQIGILISIDQN